jgi:hypothetical protein
VGSLLSLLLLLLPPLCEGFGFLFDESPLPLRLLHRLGLPLLIELLPIRLPPLLLHPPPPPLQQLRPNVRPLQSTDLPHLHLPVEVRPRTTTAPLLPRAPGRGFTAHVTEDRPRGGGYANEAGRSENEVGHDGEVEGEEGRGPGEDAREGGSAGSGCGEARGGQGDASVHPLSRIREGKAWLL